MTTLHALRRTYSLSFSELAILTSIPVRRLAEFEYHGHALSTEERRNVASFFGVAEQTLEGGFVSRVASQPTLTQTQARALAITAAAAALVWSLRAPAGDMPIPAAHPALAAVGAPRTANLELRLPVQATPEAALKSLPDARGVVRLQDGHDAIEAQVQDAPAPARAAEFADDDVVLTHGAALANDAQPAVSFAATDSRPAASGDIDEAIQRHAPLPTPTPVPTPAPVVAALSQSLHVEQLAAPPPVPVAETAPIAAEPALNASHKHKPPTPTPVPPPVVASAPATQVQASRYGMTTLSLSDNATPHRCPVVPARGRPAITQGYAGPSHVPTHEWGGIDLGVAGGPTAGATVVATHAGYARVALDTWPAGNFVAISGDAGWRTAYAHLDTVLVQPGQYVEAGTPIGTIGNSGNTTGPHLHYETWFNGTNVDPSPVLSCK